MNLINLVKQTINRHNELVSQLGCIEDKENQYSSFHEFCEHITPVEEEIHNIENKKFQKLVNKINLKLTEIETEMFELKKLKKEISKISSKHHFEVKL